MENLQEADSTLIGPSIHQFSIPALSVAGGLEPVPVVIGGRRGTPWTGRQSITGPHRDTRDKHPHTLTLTPKDNLGSPVNLTYACFGRWVEAGVPGENPRIHGENVQTPHRHRLDTKATPSLWSFKTSNSSSIFKLDRIETLTADNYIRVTVETSLKVCFTAIVSYSVLHPPFQIPYTSLLFMKVFYKEKLISWFKIQYRISQHWYLVQSNLIQFI